MDNKRKVTDYEFYMYVTSCKYIAGEITLEESERRIAKIQKLKDEGKIN